MNGCVIGWIAALVAAMVVLLGRPSTAWAQVPDVGEGTCTGESPCYCPPTGEWSDPQPCGYDCEGWCRSRSGGGSGGGSSAGAPQGRSLLDLIVDAFTPPTPPPPTPEQIAAAEEAARLRQEELARAAAEYQASVEARLAREARGRDLLHAWAAMQAALARARGGGMPLAYAKPLLAPRPKRARMPAGAATQARCAAFAGALAMNMGVWHHAGVPPADPVFLDAERLAGEARAPFDSGTAVAGCDGYDVRIAGQRGQVDATPARDPRQAGAELGRTLLDMGPAAKALQEALVAHDNAQAKLRAIEERLAPNPEEELQDVDRVRLEAPRKDLEQALQAARQERDRFDALWQHLKELQASLLAAGSTGPGEPFSRGGARP